MIEVIAGIGRIILLSAAIACFASVLFLAGKILWEYLKYYLAKKYRLRLGRKPETANTFSVGDLVRLSDTSATIFTVLAVSEDYILITDASDGRNRWYQRGLFQPYAAEAANLESLGQEYEEILNCQQTWENVHGTHDRS